MAKLKIYGGVRAVGKSKVGCTNETTEVSADFEQGEIC